MVVDTAPAKLWWGELEEGNFGDLNFLLPLPVVIRPDENGVKKVIEYRFNKDCNKMKITTTTRSRKLTQARLSKHALERCEWKKFGDAANSDGADKMTMVSTEEIVLEARAPAPDGAPKVDSRSAASDERRMQAMREEEDSGIEWGNVGHKNVHGLEKGWHQTTEYVVRIE